MIERIKDLEYKLVTRESRPEDRERIAQLEKEVAEKEYLCKRIMEEMKYFKVKRSCPLSLSLSLGSTPIVVAAKEVALPRRACLGCNQL